MNTDPEIAELPGYFFFKKDDGFEKVFEEDILYGEAKGSYTEVFTKKDNYLISRNLSYLLSNLQAYPDFLRVHRSYFVNIREVEKYYKDYLLVGQKQIPVSKAYRHEISKRFKFF